jgi:hypothetical protein
MLLLISFIIAHFYSIFLCACIVNKMMIINNNRDKQKSALKQEQAEKLPAATKVHTLTDVIISSR